MEPPMIRKRGPRNDNESQEKKGVEKRTVPDLAFGTLVKKHMHMSISVVPSSRQSTNASLIRIFKTKGPRHSCGKCTASHQAQE